MSSLGNSNRGKKSAVYGAIVDQRGNGASVEVLPERYPDDKAGYAPEKLDPVVATLIENAETGSQMLVEYSPILKAVMQKVNEQLAAALERLTPKDLPYDASEEDKKREAMLRDLAFNGLLELADKAAQLLERVNKMVFQSVRSKDTASRLRAFLAGVGEDKDGADGLANLSENELRRRIVDAAQGWSSGESE
jgi:hypothetical protein